LYGSRQRPDFSPEKVLYILFSEDFMNDETRSAPASLRIAAIAVLTALTFVIGLIRVPLPATQGIFTLADVAIFCAAFALGPLSAAFAGAVGTGLIDLIGGTAQYAPTSFVVHGLEGLVAGLIALAASGKASTVLLWILAGLAGTAVMAGGYLLAETLFYGGFATAFTEVVFNVAQGVAGAVGGALIAVAVKRGYPPLSRLRW
jgi:uncharacterized membrane protein